MDVQEISKLAEKHFKALADSGIVTSMNRPELASRLLSAVLTELGFKAADAPTAPSVGPLQSAANSNIPVLESLDQSLIGIYQDVTERLIDNLLLSKL
ncbi:hypothetical protein J0X15_04940 [Roseibium sp. CAU 1637]|uniref:Uncharacterized protein n=1 Tax=Roseibium limicola TaxID=2816037 RepID=A0A939EL05_9HYPH|nr:hypothetical protein [Roseibium limicola]MBO0344561.1 hypothetical protein [Roseibium limicola]